MLLIACISMMVYVISLFHCRYLVWVMGALAGCRIRYLVWVMGALAGCLMVA
jgi:hypothetical protein